jgi:hypothetical protein
VSVQLTLIHFAGEDVGDEACSPHGCCCGLASIGLDGQSVRASCRPAHVLSTSGFFNFPDSCMHSKKLRAMAMWPCVAVWVAAALCSVADGFTPKDSMHCVKWMATPPETPIRSEANHGRCAHTTLKLCCAIKKLCASAQLCACQHSTVLHPPLQRLHFELCLRPRCHITLYFDFIRTRVAMRVRGSSVEGSWVGATWRPPPCNVRMQWDNFLIWHTALATTAVVATDLAAQPLTSINLELNETSYQW